MSEEEEGSFKASNGKTPSLGATLPVRADTFMLARLFCE